MLVLVLKEEEEEGSPKTKNLMKAPIRRTMESWPMMKPWAKERLRRECVSGEREIMNGERWRRRKGRIEGTDLEVWDEVCACASGEGISLQQLGGSKRQALGI